MANKTAVSDERIVGLYWARDEEAIVLTQGKYGGLCRTVSRQILRDARDVEECVNDTYLAAWNTIPPQRPVSLKYYVCKLVRRISMDRADYNQADKRDVRRTVSYEEIGGEIDEMFSEAGFSCDDAVLTAAINGYLGTMSARNRDMMVLRFWLCCSVPEIAERTGVKANTVKTILSREVKGLRKYLIEKGVYEDAENA